MASLAYREVVDSAVTDELTGLPNARSLFLQLHSELARSCRTNTPLMVLILDLDGFKEVNDRFGHLAGNKVLQMIAEGLRKRAASTITWPESGGDEFVAIAAGVTREQMVAKSKQYEQVTQDVGMALYQQDILSLSVGAACFPDGADAEQLLALADKRMYRFKQLRGRSEPTGTTLSQSDDLTPALLQ